MLARLSKQLKNTTLFKQSLRLFASDTTRDLVERKDFNPNERTALQNHKWLEYDPTHTRSQKTHLSNAEQLIAKIPVIFVDHHIVRCIGGTEVEAGHQQIYIRINEKAPTSCKYCGLRFQQKPHHHYVPPEF
eukprot:TRINITY_DN905_c0_g1_i1.p1 TRINITY_DN905_c0_g1~~TRINITY_DN905_c0_g1_i1.p1  ORF type:complete len:132 (-),score=7.08 TRINITY_DN905_c0_g1_i1:103-498(-)